MGKYKIKAVKQTPQRHITPAAEMRIHQSSSAYNSYIKSDIVAKNSLRHLTIILNQNTTFYTQLNS